MGLSILAVMFFHFGIEMPLLHTISLYGWIGVDMFIFLSAIGLCFSLEKNPCITDYYKRRLLRILPTWWTYMIVVVMLNKKKDRLLRISRENFIMYARFAYFTESSKKQYQ